ncbi:helix-turn-helix domain-containing protein [Microbispora amethystogenes]|uniref:helix-turn-helix domain-containing protein n=1 Tax=Microbispora amethystogenes TaxID=1427754 RepID=UPI0033D66D15
MSRKRDEQYDERIKSLYGEGKSIRQVADAIGKSYGFVQMALEAMNVTRRKRGGNHRKPATAATADTAK